MILLSTKFENHWYNNSEVMLNTCEHIALWNLRRTQRPICPLAQLHVGSNWIANYVAFSDPWKTSPNSEFPRY